MYKIIKVTVTTEFVDEATGEVFKDVREYADESVKTTAKKSTSTKKKSSRVDDSDPEPKLYLEDNKYILNTSAIEALGVEVGDTIDIKNQKVGTARVKVIGASETFGTKSGNKLTKSNSVSYRGKRNSELAALGDVFTLTPHPNADGLFILTGNKQPNAVDDVPEAEDENIEINEIEDIDADAVEISEDAFNFEL